MDVVAKKLNVSLNIVKKMVRDRQIPVVRLSRKVMRFNLQKVEVAVAKLEIRPRLSID
jgi:excisionase family DNA binding protein